eukprot:TRINITY_DN2756_c0_g2_i1.p1 TRINITY_DN2756_c0_g2~~TRINITY_DN2756_c0_g2_i1.p1  ORF type:complete len:395 (+),score=47.73 TRINITY_DN2756_c0_g2_i1:87-1271(+)
MKIAAFLSLGFLQFASARKEQLMEECLAAFEEHLVAVQHCVREMGTDEKHPCIEYGDVAKRECLEEADDRMDLLYCMGEQEGQLNGTELEIPELIKARGDLERCLQPKSTSFDRLDEHNIHEVSEALLSCGFVFLKDVVPRELALQGETAARSFLQGPDLANYYHDANVSGKFEANLRAERYETAPPVKDVFIKILETLAETKIPQMLESLYDGVIPDLGYASLLAQRANATSEAMEAQPPHFDSPSDDVKIQVALHDYGREDGPTHFVPVSHRLSYTPMFFDDRWGDIPGEPEYLHRCGKIPISKDFTKSGDVGIYWTGTLHYGGERSSTQPRVIFDSYLYPPGRYNFGRENWDQSHGRLPAAAEALKTYQQVWKERASKRKSQMPGKSKSEL